MNLYQLNNAIVFTNVYPKVSEGKKAQEERKKNILVLRMLVLHSDSITV